MLGFVSKTGGDLPPTINLHEENLENDDILIDHPLFFKNVLEGSPVASAGSASYRWSQLGPHQSRRRRASGVFLWLRVLVELQRWMHEATGIAGEQKLW